jgi:S-DNA-T family DNA segregation ATPase FtsK/SpoIIIE
MARKKQKTEKRQKRNPLATLKPETKISIYGITALGAAVVFLLAPFEQAGIVGHYLFSFFNGAFGIGYYLVPITLVLIGIHLLTGSGEKKFMGLTLAGSSLIILSGLGLIDVLSPESAGIVGEGLGVTEKLFGYWAAIVLHLALFVIAILITLNTSLHVTFPRLWGASLKKKASDKDPVIMQNGEVMKEDEVGKKEEGPQEEKAPEEEIEKEKESLSKKLKDTLTKKSGIPAHLDQNYVMPPLSLLNTERAKPTVGDLRGNANIIKRTLESFGIAVEMGEITVGPKVTRYTLKPAEGVKLSRITALNQDLSLALAAHPIRIEAPIPGKSLIGIEIPNKSASIVRLGNLFADDEYLTSAPLSCPLGRDVTGDPTFIDLAKMPHVLIAGATGSGKSVTIHSLIMSLLCKNSPDMLRLILIDPKRVELSVYEGLPHLAASVITEGKKAIAALRFCIEEMDRRYEVLLQAGSRDIGSYNKKREGVDRMPYLVLVMDELADLMVTYGREVEGSIVRLAQMARATGIHLVISTQRPSVDVITGLIKANIPSRIALQVASQIDSRTILDMSGAEKLLGGGDMLILTTDISKPRRVQGAYIDDSEVKKVVSFIKKENTVVEADDSIEANIEEHMDKNPQADLDEYLENHSGSDEDGDELLEDAVEVVRKAQKASASLLQRRLRVGYARAARLLDIMEDRGIIGPGEGAKPREVYISEHNDDER